MGERGTLLLTRGFSFNSSVMTVLLLLLLLLGETETLGLWEESVPLTWSEGDVWTGECELAPG